MSSQPVDHLHPVVELAQRPITRLGSLGSAPLIATPEQTRDVLVSLT